MINIKQIRKELGLSKNGDVYIRKVESGKAEASGLLLKALELLTKVKQLDSLK